MGPALTPVHWVQGFFPRLQIDGHEADHSPMSRAGVKNSGSIPPHPNNFYGVVLN
jgi:hypothetical protein